MVSGQEKILAIVQNMIYKSLGKQPLINDGSAPKFNVDSTFQYNTKPPESSAAFIPHYGMPMNFYNGQKSPDQYRTHGGLDRSLQPVRPVMEDRCQLVLEL